MTLTIGGKWQLRPYDRRNWSLWEWRTADPKNAKTRSTEPKWFKCDEYFQSVGMALSRIFEYALRDDATEWTGEQLSEMVEHVEAVARELRESVEVAA